MIHDKTVMLIFGNIKPIMYVMMTSSYKWNY